MPLTVMSFNVRGSFHDDDGVNIWSKRSRLNISTIQKYKPDIIGIQEAQTGNLSDYEDHLTAYTIELGLISIRQTERRHYVPIYYRTDRFTKVKSGGFYLSETPDVWSIGWEAIYPRAVTWIVLRDIQVNQELFVLNTHYNHEHDNQESRNQSSRLIIEHARKHAPELAQVIMADFNSRPDSEAYRMFIDMGFQDTFTSAGCTGHHKTVHAFQGEDFPHDEARIDWILLKNLQQELSVKSFEIIDDHQHPVYPSDHYPIMSQLEWTNNHA